MTITERIIRVIAEHIEVAPAAITPESNLTEDLGLDSLDMMEIHSTLEDEFGRDLPAIDLTKTVADIAARVEATTAPIVEVDK